MDVFSNLNGNDLKREVVKRYHIKLSDLKNLKDEEIRDKIREVYGPEIQLENLNEDQLKKKLILLPGNDKPTLSEINDKTKENLLKLLKMFIKHPDITKDELKTKLMLLPGNDAPTLSGIKDKTKVELFEMLINLSDPEKGVGGGKKRRRKKQSKRRSKKRRSSKKRSKRCSSKRRSKKY